jgi:8-oxo-dGTP diphosphatase
MTLILGTLVYPIRDGRVLLMHRHKAPNLGQWVGPGGKVEADESPYECAIRELYEETHLRARQPRFRGLVTEVSPRPDWHWMLFIYTVTDFEGQVAGDGREGRLRWWTLDEAVQLPIPQADAVFFPHVTDPARPFYQAKFVYDADLRLVAVHEHPGPV